MKCIKFIDVLMQNKDANIVVHTGGYFYNVDDWYTENGVCYLCSSDENKKTKVIDILPFLINCVQVNSNIKCMFAVSPTDIYDFTVDIEDDAFVLESKE